MNKEVKKFNNKVEDANLRAVCDKLSILISENLPKSTSKIYYAIPVWFIDENIIVGYSITKAGKVNLLFWSGQGFKTPGLTPEGSFKAAEVKYGSVDEVDEAQLKKWLSEAKKIIYNYKDIRQNKGKLSLLELN